MQIEYSDNVQERGLKMLLWGPTASRKTETILRFFPHVFLIDCEGNSDHCVRSPVIPPFLRIKTKNIYEILENMDKVAAGEIAFPDGSPVETLGIDGASVLWSVRQEVGALNAEKRARKAAQRHGREIDLDALHMTMLDWGVAKRPLKMLNSRLNNPGVKYVVLTARDKDEYKEVEKEGKKELVKTGTMIDAMRGLDFEVNLALQMFNTTPWKCKVTKVHGPELSTQFPVGTELTAFPHEALLTYATGTIQPVQDELAVAAQNLEQEAEKTQSDLLEVGQSLGLDAKGVAKALKAKGIQRFEAGRWDEMVEALQSFGENGR